MIKKFKTRRYGLLTLGCLLLLMTGCSSKNEGSTSGKAETTSKVGGSSSETANSDQHNVGDIITFGKYEQDNNTDNGKEDIEWIVLDKKSDGQLVLISKYVLDCQPYNTEYTEVTWETCSLRKWLNGTFMDTAFSEEEKAKIQSTTITNEDSPMSGTDGGNDTTDKVYLLSYSEASNLFGEDTTINVQTYFNPSRACKPTPYAISQKCYVGKDDDTDYEQLREFTGYCCYWLRTVGDEKHAQIVNYYGSLGYQGHVDVSGGSYINDTEDDGYGVRPVIVINP